MIYVYRTQISAGARELANALGGTILRRFEDGLFSRRRGGERIAGLAVTPQDTIICWGATLPATVRARLLNSAPLQSKLTDAQRLIQAGINTVEVSRQRPAVQQRLEAVVDPAIALYEDVKEAAEDLLDTAFSRTPVLSQGLEGLRVNIAALQRSLLAPLPAGRPVATAEWIPRSNSHVGGDDLLTPPAAPDFYAKKENLVQEFRIHSFAGKSIRAGIKVPREGYALTAGRGAQAAHAWIRSYDGGWRINYDGFESKKSMRELAHQAVKALGLQFGAVDIGERADGTLIVLEVNRAPGLEGGTVEAYAKAIRGAVDGV